MTIKESKDQAAKEFKYEDWRDVEFNAGYSMSIIERAMQIYADAKAKDESVKFAHWLANLPISKKVAVHPPSGSGGSHGIYELTIEQLYEKFKTINL